MKSIPFWKVESVGNDFVLVHQSDVDERADNVEEFLKALAIAASERRFGVGSDGLLVVSQQGGDVVLRMFNPDGTEDFCGNGLRCAAIHATAQGWVGEQFVIHHHGIDIHTSVCGEGCIETQLAAASYKPQDIPVQFKVDPDITFNRTPLWSGFGMSFFGSSLTTGSTHTILPVEKLPEEDVFQKISPAIESHRKYSPMSPETTKRTGHGLETFTV